MNGFAAFGVLFLKHTVLLGTLKVTFFDFSTLLRGLVDATITFFKSVIKWQGAVIRNSGSGRQFQFRLPGSCSGTLVLLPFSSLYLHRINKYEFEI